MLNKILDLVRENLPASATPQVAAALGRSGSAVVLGSRWEGRVVYSLFAPRERTPAVVLKVDTSPTHQPRLYREHEALLRVSQIPNMTELAPAPLGVHECGDAVVMAQTALPGTPLNVMLRRRFRHGGRRSARDHARVLAWLATFRGAASGSTIAIDPETVQQRLAKVLPIDAPGAADLSRWMDKAGADLGPVKVPARPVHGDLAPSNCFVHRGRMRVLDWEGAVPEGSPLAETLLFLNHYARAIPGSDTRMRKPTDTFREAFLRGGWLGNLTWNTWCRELVGLGLPVEACRYLFVATLVDLAGGHASTAHARRKGSQKNWSKLLALYAVG